MKKLNLILTGVGSLMLAVFVMVMSSTPAAAGPFTDCMNKILDAGKTPTYKDRIGCFGGSGTASSKPFPLWKAEEPNTDPDTDPGTESGTDPIENPKDHGPKNPATPTTGDSGQTTSGESNGNESGSDSGTSDGGGSDGDGGGSSAE